MYNIRKMTLLEITSIFQDQEVNLLLTDGTRFSAVVSYVDYDAENVDEIMLTLKPESPIFPDTVSVWEIESISLPGAEIIPEPVAAQSQSATGLVASDIYHLGPSPDADPLYNQVERDFKRLAMTEPDPQLLSAFSLRIGSPAIEFEETITVTPATDELIYHVRTGNRQQTVRLVDHALAHKTMMRLSMVDFRAVPISAMAWNLSQHPDRNVLDAMITVTRSSGVVQFLPTAYFRLGLPLQWHKVMRALRKAFKGYRKGVIFDQSVYGAGHLHGELIVLGVQFADFGKKYNYLADSDSYHVGDYVDVPVGPTNEPKSALVVDILYPQTESQLPYPISKTKHVLGKSQRIY